MCTKTSADQKSSHYATTIQHVEFVSDLNDSSVFEFEVRLCSTALLKYKLLFSNLGERPLRMQAWFNTYGCRE